MALKYNDSSKVIAEQKDVFLSAIRENPVLLKAAGIAPIAGAAISGGNALALLLLVTVLLITVGIVSAIDGDRLTQPLKTVIYAIITIVVLFFFSFVLGMIFEGFIDRLGVYAPLLAFNSLVFTRTEEDSPILSTGESVTDALSLTFSFAALVFPAALVRELLGYGTLFGLRIFYGGNQVFLYPFFGFILCGFILAALRKIRACALERSEAK